MSRPEVTPEFRYTDLGEPRRNDVSPEVHYPDFAQVFPEHAARLLARAGIRAGISDAGEYNFVLRPTTQEDYDQGIRTTAVVEIRPR